MIYDYNTLVVTEGYRLVYFYPNGNYYIGTYAKKIEDFMIEFCEFYPIIDEKRIFQNLNQSMIFYIDV